MRRSPCSTGPLKRQLDTPRSAYYLAITEAPSPEVVIGFVRLGLGGVKAAVLAPLFRSEAQALLLSELLLLAEEMSMTDLAERAGLPYPTGHREVARLLDAGLLVDRRVGRTRLIRGNEQSPLLAPTREILLTVTGPVVLLREALDDLDRIGRAFLFGSFAARAKGEPGARRRTTST